MHKDAILNQLESAHNKLFEFLELQSHEKWETGPDGKWTTGQHALHILQSIKTLNNALSLPKFLLKYRFGKANRAVRDFETVTNRYNDRLAKVNGTALGPSKNLKTPKLKDKNYFHVGIDPYGDLLYKHIDKQIDREKGTIAYWKDFEGNWMVNPDGTPKVPTYPNSMKQTFLSEFKNHENFILYQLEDTEYFNLFGGGLPIYQNGQKKLVNVYDFVHFDGPHTTEKVLEEVMFFAPRSRVGTRFVFDDIKTYEMSKIAYILEHFGFKTSEMGDDKCMLERTE